MSRASNLNEWYDVVVQAARLRPPQIEALGTIRDLLMRLPGKLSEASLAERRAAFTTGTWTHSHHPSFTAELATGVGKTRLMGAIIAFLYLTQEAKTFLVLAPRRAVLNRIDAALDPAFREYLFVVPDLVPQPKIIRADQIDTPFAVGPDETGPTIFLLSPQLIATSDRFLTRSEYADISPTEFLRRRDDLIVLADESHHIGKPSARETTAWNNAVRSLEPALQLGFTATPRTEPGVNIIYQYSLPRALDEGLYTKIPELAVRSFPDVLIDTDDLDHTTIDHALALLKIKDAAVANSPDPRAKRIKPVLLIFAVDTPHADKLEEWLLESGRVAREELLVTHSARVPNEADVENLESIEDAENPIRVVINVQQLSEGWDVTNVYVIAPLRAMATFAGAIQAIGRGLRLPAGERLRDPQLDALDVVIFGREKLGIILTKAMTWGGKSVVVRESDDDVNIAVPVAVETLRDIELDFDDLSLAVEEPSFDIRPEAFRHMADAAVDVWRLNEARSKVRSGSALVRLSRTKFVEVAASRAIRSAPRYLSDMEHTKPVREIVERWLDFLAEGRGERPVSLDEGVPFDPYETGEQIAKLIEGDLSEKAARYEQSGMTMRTVFSPYTGTIEVARGTDEAGDGIIDNEVELPNAAEIETEFRTRRLYGGWSKSVLSANSFDSPEEAAVALMLDSNSSVDWWVRNEPSRFSISTPAGNFNPDFLASLVLPDGERLLFIIEVKGDEFWNAPGSKPRVKAAAAGVWAAEQSRLRGIDVRFGVALTSDVQRNHTLQSLLPRLVPPIEVNLPP